MSNENINSRFKELSGSDFEIAEGQPDIRGWDVKDENGKKFGEVDDLLFDEQTRKVRYIILDLEGNVFDLDTKDVLVPIGIAQLDEKDDDVILPGVTVDQVRSLPEYDKENFNSEAENRIRAAFAGVGGAALAGTGDDFYSHGHFNDENLYSNRRRDTDESATIPVIQEELQVGKREVEKGGIRLRTRVVENEVEKNINLRQEKIQVERTSVDRPADVNDIKEEQLEFTERAEVPVVSKEARVVEEVSLNKEVTENEKTIQDTVKNTEVNVERTDGNDSLSKDSGRL